MEDRILRYIDDEMTAEERQAFEVELTSNTLLEEEVKNYKAAKMASSHFIESEIRGYLSNHATISKDSEAQQPLESKARWTWLILIILIGMLVWWWTNGRGVIEQTNTPIQYAQGYTPPIWPVERSNGTLISKACALHLAGQTDQALNLLMAEEESMTLEMKYWAAEIMISVDRCNEVKPLLDEVNKEGYEEERVNKLIKYCE